MSLYTWLFGEPETNVSNVKNQLEKKIRKAVGHDGHASIYNIKGKEATYSFTIAFGWAIFFKNQTAEEEFKKTHYQRYARNDDGSLKIGSRKRHWNEEENKWDIYEIPLIEANYISCGIQSPHGFYYATDDAIEALVSNLDWILEECERQGEASRISLKQQREEKKIEKRERKRKKSEKNQSWLKRIGG
jgi:hypothetical protein